MDSGLLGQAVQYHGPELVRCLQIEQQQVPVSLTDHLNKYRQRQPNTSRLRRDISQRIHSFVAKKADYLFNSVEDASGHPASSSDDDTYAKMPPIESFMGVDWTAARRHFFNSLERYDIVIGVVTTALESGLVLTLLCLDNDKARDIDEMKITAFCPAKELPRVPYQSPLEGFAVKDKVRGVVVNVNSESERIIVSLNERALSEEQETVKLGLINADDFPVQYRRKLHIRGLTFDELLHSIVGFNNQGNVSFLLDTLKLDETSSYMRGLHKKQVPEKEMSEGLRKQQSQKWAHQCVADGIKYFKMGRQTEAIQYLNKALQIDETNVEALTARGALYANNESYNKAMEDFEEALRINPTHQNAKKYMYETLLAVARVKEDLEAYEEAEMYVKKALDIEPQSVEAREALRFLLYKKERHHSSDRYRKPSRHDEHQDSDEDMFMGRTTATLKKLINEDKSRSGKKRRDRSPQGSKSRRSRSRSPRSEGHRDLFGSNKYDSIPGLDLGQEASDRRNNSPPRQRYRSKSPDESPSRMYNVDHQSSFMSKGSDFFKDLKDYSDRKGTHEGEYRDNRDYSRDRDREFSREREYGRDQDRRSLEGSRERSLDRNADKQNQGRNPDREIRRKDKYAEGSRGLQRNPERGSLERSQDWRNIGIPDSHKERQDKNDIDFLYGDIGESQRDRQEKGNPSFTENLMNIRPKSDRSLQIKDRNENHPASQTRRSVSPRDRKGGQKTREGMYSKEEKRENEFTSSDKGNTDSESPVKKKKSKKMKNKDSKGEKRKRKNKGSVSPSDKRYPKEDGEDRKKDDWESQGSYGKDRKTEFKDKDSFEADLKPKLDKKYKKRREYSTDKEVEKKKQVKGGSLEEVVKSRWDSPSDEKYYKSLNSERKSRFDADDKPRDKLQKPKQETASKFSNTFKETMDKKDFSKVKEEPVGPPTSNPYKSSSRERDNSYPKAETKKFALPSKEELDREFEGIRIHIRNDKYNAVEEPKAPTSKLGVRPFDSVEEDPVSIVSALHTDQIYAPKPEPVFQEEMFEVKLKREDSPTYERPKSNYRQRRSSSSSSSSKSRSPSRDKDQRRKAVRHDKRSRSKESKSHSPGSRYSQSERKRSRSPHHVGDKNPIGKKLYEINRYNKNRFKADGKSVTIKPFIKLEIDSRGRGARGVGMRGGNSGMRGGIRGGAMGRGDSKFVEGRGKFIPRGRGVFRGRRQFQAGRRGRGGNFRGHSHYSKHRSRGRSDSRSRSRSRSKGRSRSRSRSRGRSRSRSRSRSGHRSRSRSRSKHRSRSPKNRPPKSKSPNKKRGSWSPPIGQGSGYYGPRAKDKPGKPVDGGIPGGNVPSSDNAPVTTEGKGSLEMMETFLEQLRQKKMQAAANNNF